MTTQEILSNVFCSFMGTVGFAIMYNVPSKYYFGCGVTGMAGWIMFLIVNAQNYITSAVASFFGAFVVVLMSRILSVRMKCPITIFLISGIFPLVPGVGIYNTVYYIVTNQLNLEAVKGIGTFKIVLEIVIIIVSLISIPRLVFVDSYYWSAVGEHSG